MRLEISIADLHATKRVMEKFIELADYTADHQEEFPDGKCAGLDKLLFMTIVDRVDGVLAIQAEETSEDKWRSQGYVEGGTK